MEKNNLAVANAVKVIKRFNFKSPDEIDFDEIANTDSVKIIYDYLKSALGKIVISSGVAVITISKDIKLETRKRFTIAHELGHFYNERGFQVNDKLSYTCKYDDIFGNYSRNGREKNANDFAAELLMHTDWFVNFTKGKKFNYKLLKDLSQYFNVSLTSAAIRYSEIGQHPTASIFIKDKKIKWTVINKFFKYKFIRINSNVSNLSYVNDHLNGKEYPTEGEEILAEAWFSEDFNLKNRNDRLFEIVIPFENYDSALVILLSK
ncbi:MAG: ImmA/IrrE family metallo-endopeptidase [Ignavibacterium sp.]|nr:ImmA/IrrE family metallo-endopeptidase [Ignavibacterium sp.]MCX7612463.1 ImmA/IrrE family metallo-endopeptidase [Ignavibacterium sp.]MDW8374843.1 ImmA/IrrE family metallo-endopeptidase [Ignavibacteriales bacterium]